MGAPMVLYDFEIIRGETFMKDISLESVTDGVIDLSDYSVQAQVRRNPGAEDLIAQMECTVSEDGKKVELFIPASQTKNIKGGTYYYDVPFISGQNGRKVEYMLGGKFVVHDSVTVVQ